jgi:hypothetical protein
VTVDMLKDDRAPLGWLDYRSVGEEIEAEVGRLVSHHTGRPVSQGGRS